MTNLLHPDLLEASVGGGKAIERLEARAGQVAIEPVGHGLDVGVSLVIRTQNNADNIEQLYQEIEGQNRWGDTEVIFVDTESNDGTPDRIRAHGGTIISITQDDFNYPRALNLGFEAASYDTVFSTVGHANFTNTQTLSAAIQHIEGGGFRGIR
jgi:hypothetical protein